MEATPPWTTTTLTSSNIMVGLLTTTLPICSHTVIPSKTTITSIHNHPTTATTTVDKTRWRNVPCVHILWWPVRNMCRTYELVGGAILFLCWSWPCRLFLVLFCVCCLTNTTRRRLACEQSSARRILPRTKNISFTRRDTTVSFQSLSVVVCPKHCAMGQTRASHTNFSVILHPFTTDDVWEYRYGKCSP